MSDVSIDGRLCSYLSSFSYSFCSTLMKNDLSMVHSVETAADDIDLEWTLARTVSTLSKDSATCTYLDNPTPDSLEGLAVHFLVMISEEPPHNLGDTRRRGCQRIKR